METKYSHIGIALMPNIWEGDFKKIILFLHNTYVFSPYILRGRFKVKVAKYNQKETQYEFDAGLLDYKWFIGIKIRQK